MTPPSKLAALRRRRIGRPRRCYCGACKRCQRTDAQRRWWEARIAEFLKFLPVANRSTVWQPFGE